MKMLGSRGVRISEAARRLGISPRMLRYREELGLLPALRRGPGHRQFAESDLAAIRAGMELERRYDITPAALAFGLRVLTEPAVRAAVADLGRRTGHVPAGPGRALDFEKERALRALGRTRLALAASWSPAWRWPVLGHGWPPCHSGARGPALPAPGRSGLARSGAPWHQHSAAGGRRKPGTTLPDAVDIT